MFFKLPYDVLLHIGEMLSMNDQSTCSTVCKQWRKPFQDAIWGVLDVSMKNLGRICETVKRINMYTTNGHRVWALKVLHLDSYSEQQLQIIQKVFPNTEYFEYIRSTLGPPFITSVLNWSLWKSLTHLCVPLEASIQKYGSNSVFGQLSTIQGLVYLSIKRDSHVEKETRFTWEDIQTLHFYLPRLEYLENDLVLDILPYGMVETISWIGPASTVKTVKYGSVKLSKMWMLFFVLKYPNIQAISFGLLWNGYAPEQNVDNPQSILIFQPSTFFPRLKRVTIDGLYSDPQTIMNIYEIFNEFRVPIEHLEIHALINTTELRIKEQIVASTRWFSRTLKVLRMCINFSGEDEFEYIINIGLYSRLVELQLSSQGDIIEFYSIMDQCPDLKSLTISKAFLEFRPSRDYYMSHSLLKLDLESVTIVSHAMYQISLLCTQLKTLKMRSLNILDAYFNETGHIVLDMPCSQLNDIGIGDIICNGYHCHIFLIHQVRTSYKFAIFANILLRGS
ncbi:hypothetical protein CLU79DRAFT_838592 [Phycomyces nitens]|nr:hypothetical protein CLU79DRAFT_838592 [Phycomyces nitens]